jgi:hypothetical protein
VPLPVAPAAAKKTLLAGSLPSPFAPPRAVPPAPGGPPPAPPGAPPAVAAGVNKTVGFGAVAPPSAQGPKQAPASALNRTVAFGALSDDAAVAPPADRRTPPQFQGAPPAPQAPARQGLNAPPTGRGTMAFDALEASKPNNPQDMSRTVAFVPPTDAEPARVVDAPSAPVRARSRKGLSATIAFGQPTDDLQRAAQQLVEEAKQRLAANEPAKPDLTRTQAFGAAEQPSPMTSRGQGVSPSAPIEEPPPMTPRGQGRAPSIEPAIEPAPVTPRGQGRAPSADATGPRQSASVKRKKGLSSTIAFGESSDDMRKAIDEAAARAQAAATKAEMSRTMAFGAVYTPPDEKPQISDQKPKSSELNRTVAFGAIDVPTAAPNVVTSAPPTDDMGRTVAFGAIDVPASPPVAAPPAGDDDQGPSSDLMKTVAFVRKSEPPAAPKAAMAPAPGVESRHVLDVGPREPPPRAPQEPPPAAPPMALPHSSQKKTMLGGLANPFAPPGTAQPPTAQPLPPRPAQQAPQALPLHAPQAASRTAVGGLDAEHLQHARDQAVAQHQHGARPHGAHQHGAPQYGFPQHGGPQHGAVDPSGAFAPQPPMQQEPSGVFAPQDPSGAFAPDPSGGFAPHADLSGGHAQPLDPSGAYAPHDPSQGYAPQQGAMMPAGYPPVPQQALGAPLAKPKSNKLLVAVIGGSVLVGVIVAVLWWLWR